jgi:TRAP-type mannitol/chloroaromatic compound transport system permease small subunit
MASLIAGIISITIVVIVFSNVLMPTINNTNTTGWSTSETSLWDTVGLIAVVGIVFVMLQVFGVNA